jgi:hypothetical protein
MRAMSDQLPPCGIYRTLKPVGSVEAGRLVYFHNHGNPGPGVYFPERWTHNKAHWSEGGVTVPEGFDYKGLMALPAEGFYRVTSAFHCCEKQCTKFEADAFVQLGYNGAGRAILFVPELAASGLHIPDRGSILDDKVLVNLSPLKVPEREARNDLSVPRGMIVH